MGAGVLEPIDRRQVSDIVMQKILDLMAAGTSKVGDRLPSERELVRRLHVSRPSIREALKRLESLGLVEIKQGLGVYIADPGKANVSVESLRAVSRGRDTDVLMMEARKVIETTCARLAAERATPDGLKRVSGELARFEVAVEAGNADQIVEADLAFHEAVIRSTNNPVFLQMLNPVNEMLLEGRRRTTGLPRNAARALKSHREIHDYVLAGDGDGAEQSMADHLEDALELLVQEEAAADLTGGG